MCTAVPEVGCCTPLCAFSSDSVCDDGGAGSEYSLCALGSDCADCGSRCYLSPVPASPYVHSAWPSVTINTGGRYPGQDFSTRAAIFHGAWTFSFVARGSDIAQWGSKKLIYDHYSSRGDFRNMDSSVGIGSQLYCGYSQTGTSCQNGNRELDRGSCTAQTLFGDDHYYTCRNGAPDGSNCPYGEAAERNRLLFLRLLAHSMRLL